MVSAIAIAIAVAMSGIGRSAGYVLDMNVDAMIGSALERVAPISRQIWDGKWACAAERN
jgi:hypothetical protein